MKEYYTLNYQCPSCLEPYKSGYAQKQLSDFIYNCNKCHATYSHEGISKDKGFSTLTENPAVRAKISRFIDLCDINTKFWKIENNDLEISYIENSLMMKGVNIITWPWSEVRFIPVMVSEMLSRTEHSKIVLIGRSDYQQDSGYYSSVDLMSNMTKLFYIENHVQDDELHKYLKKEFKHIDIFRETNIIKATISYRGAGKYTRVRDFFRVSLKRVKKIITADDDSIRWTSPTDGSTENNDEIIKLSRLKKKNFPLSGAYRYPEWIADVIDNSDSIVFPFRKLKPGPYFKCGNFLYIDESQEVKSIEDYIKAFEPDFIIIERLDSFYSMFNDSRELYRHLLSFNTAVIAFSANRDIRERYLSPKDITFAMKNGVIFHAIDNDRIMDYYDKNNTARTYASALSSGKYVSYPRNYPAYDFTTPEYLKELQDLDIYTECFDKNKINMFKRFLEYLQLSPLPVFDGKNGAMYYDNEIASGVDYYAIYRNLLSGQEDFDRSLHAIYDKYPISPAVDIIIKQIGDIKNKYGVSAHIFVAVISSDVKKIQRLMVDQDLGSHVTFGKWSDLMRYRETDFYVITNLIPDYIYPDKVKMIYFIGNEKRVAEFRLKMSYRISNFSSRPFINPDDKNVPGFLYEMYRRQSGNMSEIYGIDDYKALNYRILDAASDHDYNDPQDNRNNYIRKLKKGSTVFVFYDEENHPLVIVPGSSIIILDPGFSEYKITEKISNSDQIYAIRGKYMLIKNSTTYISFKQIFIKLMEEYGNTIKFERGIYTWDNFKYLYENSIKWKLDINSAVQVLIDKNQLDEEAAKSIIASEIASSGIFAKNEEYMKLWMDISDENYEVINIERPHSLEDLYKIYKSIEKYGIKVDYSEIRKCYYAILTLQKFRHDTMTGNDRDFNGDVEFIHDRMAENLSSMPRFHICRIDKGIVTLDMDVENYNINDLLKNLLIK